MQIGIDASRALRPERTGTEHYSFAILYHLLRLPLSGRHEWVLYADAPPKGNRAQDLIPADYPRDAPLPQWRILRSRRLWTHRALAPTVAGDAPDVLFIPAHVVPFALPVRRLPPTVVTIHDVGYRFFPDAHTVAQRRYLDVSTRWSLHAARSVICVSGATARDIQSEYGTDPRKIAIVHEAGAGGTGAGLREEDEPIAPVPGLPAGRRYALFMGTIQPRKNVERIIIAFDRISHQVDWDLVLVGKPGWKSEPIYTRARSVASRDRIHLTGYLAGSEADHARREALFFCFPSLFEGFGLPVLEAQSVGVPVLTSDNSSLPEIAGNAALFVDPTDVDAIADAMLRISSDEELRQRLVAAGHENVKRFSWEKAARETLAVLEDAAQQTEQTRG